jgi:hypothetical protein
MIYIFDNNTLVGIFRHYYRESFPTFWSFFDKMVDEGSIRSVFALTLKFPVLTFKNSLKFKTGLFKKFL